MAHVEPIFCPLCQAGEMKLHEEKAKGESIYKAHVTYIWSCEDCPGMLIEWYDPKDTKAFDKYTRRPFGKE
jgi:hypothetical protein